MPDLNKRNRIYQLASANMFYSWAEVLADKLEAILDAQEKNKSLNRIYKYDMAAGSQAEIVAEDFYDEGNLKVFFFSQSVLLNTRRTFKLFIFSCSSFSERSHQPERQQLSVRFTKHRLFALA